MTCVSVENLTSQEEQARKRVPMKGENNINTMFVSIRGKKVKNAFIDVTKRK